MLAVLRKSLHTGELQMGSVQRLQQGCAAIGEVPHTVCTRSKGLQEHCIHILYHYKFR